MVVKGLFGLGQYPPEYNRKIHGPYDPARFYGKPDTPFAEVKIGELGSWLTRRNYNPRAMIQAISRSHWAWKHRYVHPRRASMAGYVQLCVGMSFLFFIINYGKIRDHRLLKYHW